MFTTEVFMSLQAISYLTSLAQNTEERPHHDARMVFAETTSELRDSTGSSCPRASSDGLSSLPPNVPRKIPALSPHPLTRVLSLLSIAANTRTLVVDEPGKAKQAIGVNSSWDFKGSASSNRPDMSSDSSRRRRHCIRSTGRLPHPLCAYCRR
jgi:hypothetical protein